MKNYIKENFSTQFDHFKYTFIMIRKLWIPVSTYICISIIIPLFMTFMYIIVFGFLGVKSKLQFHEAVSDIWIRYYYSGDVFSIPNWRIHLLILIGCIVLFILDKFDGKIK